MASSWPDASTTVRCFAIAPSGTCSMTVVVASSGSPCGDNAAAARSGGGAYHPTIIASPMNPRPALASRPPAAVAILSARTIGHPPRPSQRGHVRRLENRHRPGSSARSSPRDASIAEATARDTPRAGSGCRWTPATPARPAARVLGVSSIPPLRGDSQTPPPILDEIGGARIGQMKEWNPFPPPRLGSKGAMREYLRPKEWPGGAFGSTDRSDPTGRGFIRPDRHRTVPRIWQ
jgi:hypothetical protein